MKRTYLHRVYNHAGEPWDLSIDLRSVTAIERMRGTITLHFGTKHAISIPELPNAPGLLNPQAYAESVAFANKQLVDAWTAAKEGA